MLPAVLGAELPPPLEGLSTSLLLLVVRFVVGGVTTEAWLVTPADAIDKDEFFRDAAFELFAVAFFFRLPPTGRLAPEPLFLFLITSVFKLRGRTTPCSFRNRPQALHKGCPSGLRLHRGVVWVKQFVHVVGVLPSPWIPAAAACKFVDELCLDARGDEGLLGATEEKPDMVPAASPPPGEFGND